MKKGLFLHRFRQQGHMNRMF